MVEEFPLESTTFILSKFTEILLIAALIKWLLVLFLVFDIDQPFALLIVKLPKLGIVTLFYKLM
jgi:hypothetical protein